MITDFLVERAAKALEKKLCQSKYGWSDAEFEIWWTKDPYFVEIITSWGDGFGRGTRKEYAIWKARIMLEEVFGYEFSKRLRGTIHNALIDGPRLESDLASDFYGLVDSITDRVETIINTGRVHP